MIKIFNKNDKFPNFIVNHYPNLKAKIIGIESYKNVVGTIEFFETNAGILVVSEVFNLPTETSDENFFEIKIDLNATQSLQERNRPILGDLPDLLSNNGYSYSIVLSNYFNLFEILGKQVVISRNRRNSQNNDDKIIVATGIITR